jgi:hypothetical protein
MLSLIFGKPSPIHMAVDGASRSTALPSVKHRNTAHKSYDNGKG